MEPALADQLPTDEPAPATTPGASPVPAPRSADRTVRRLLRVPEGRPVVDESATHRIFSLSIFLSALRCLLSYIVLPVLLPLLGLAKGVGPIVGIPVALLALTFDVLGVRRFWLADHRQKWAFTGLYVVVGTMVAVLLVVDIVDLVR